MLQIKSALISVYDKAGIEPIAKKLHDLNIKIYSEPVSIDIVKGSSNLEILDNIFVNPNTIETIFITSIPIFNNSLEIKAEFVSMI